MATMTDKYKEEFALATKLGWEIDTTKMRSNGPLFIKNNIHLWKIRNGWQCADLIDNYFKNHRPYTDLTTALKSEK